MDLRIMTPFDDYLLAALHNNLGASAAPSSQSPPTKAYVREAQAMASTPADVIDTPTSYSFVIDIPGLKVGDINVQVEDDSLLVISSNRKREGEGEDSAKYLRMERRDGKFVLPENADKDTVTILCHDGVLTITVPSFLLRSERSLAP